MEVATYFFEVESPSSIIESTLLYPLKECQSNKVVGVCTANGTMLRCWISKDVSFKLEIDNENGVYFTYNSHLARKLNSDCYISDNRVDYFSHGIISPFKIDETSVKVRVYCNANSER